MSERRVAAAVRSEPIRWRFELAEPGTEYVITRYRASTQNLGTQLTRITKRAGLAPWPKRWHNLQSTRQTELEERFPSHVVCAWLGNSRQVAAAHYLRVIDEHFERAAMGESKVLQKAVQHPRPPVCTAGNAQDADTEKQGVFAGVPESAPPFNGEKSGQVGVTGLEPVTSSV